MGTQRFCLSAAGADRGVIREMTIGGMPPMALTPALAALAYGDSLPITSKTIHHPVLQHGSLPPSHQCPSQRPSATSPIREPVPQRPSALLPRRSNTARRRRACRFSTNPSTSTRSRSKRSINTRTLSNSASVEETCIQHTSHRQPPKSYHLPKTHKKHQNDAKNRTPPPKPVAQTIINQHHIYQNHTH